MKVYPLHNTDETEYDGMITNGIYLHGKLQDDVGFDLCWIPFFGCCSPYRKGKYDDDEFEIEINGETKKVNVYVWDGKIDDTEIREKLDELDSLFDDFKNSDNKWKARELLGNIVWNPNFLARFLEGYHGLVVYADDKEAVEYAEKAYETKPNHI